jgi:hypothetical protein
MTRHSPLTKYISIYIETQVCGVAALLHSATAAGKSEFLRHTCNILKSAKGEAMTENLSQSIELLPEAMAATPPDALLFIAPGCPHCPAVLHGLSALLEESLIGKMTVVNVAAHPELAEEQDVRAAPWLRLGPFTLTGAHSPAELRLWAERAGSEEGTAHYVEHLLKQGGYRQAAVFIAEDTHRLKPLLAIIANPAASLDVRLGVSALLEAHANELQQLLPLADLTRHADHRVRADACHLLGLTGSRAARSHVEICLGDAHEEVREIAEEAWTELANA